MKLVSFSVSNFRSITQAYKLPLGDYAVLVGPNNEGKSNLLRAIGIGLSLLSRGRYYLPRRHSLRYTYRETQRFDYDWGRDFPVGLQANKPEGRSQFTLEFSLTPEELQAFNSAVGGHLATNLKVKLSLGREEAKAEILLKGRAKSVYNKHMQEIAAFIAQHIVVQYIPSIRTSRLAIDVMEDILERELAQLEKDPAYVALVQKVGAAQKPILESIGREMTQTIRGFVPDVKEIRLRTEEELLHAVRRSCSVLVDDGALTNLEEKGDGVKSLIAISLLRHSSQGALGAKSLILAVEEPESHLHPAAIHRLREVLLEIAHTHQVIIATHSPVLVDRANINRNIIVDSGKAVAAKCLRDIRETLGVVLSDNLAGAHLVLLVEGTGDKSILESWLTAISNKLRECRQNGLLVLETLSGSPNLRHKTSLYKSLLCNVFAFMDNDNAGRNAVRAAIDARALSNNEYKLAVCPGMKESELEDFVIVDSHRELLKKEFDVDLQHASFAKGDFKWSQRMRSCFENQGRIWDEDVAEKVKQVVAQAAAAQGLASLNRARSGPIDSLARALEERLPG